MTPFPRHSYVLFDVASCLLNLSYTATGTNETISHNEQITTETISTPSESPRESLLLNDAQLAQIQSIVAQTVQQSVNDIATNAVRAEVQTMASTPVPTSTSDAQQSEPLLDNATAIIQTEHKTPHGSLRIRPAATTRVPYEQSFHVSSYVIICKENPVG